MEEFVIAVRQLLLLQMMVWLLFIVTVQMMK